MTNTSQDVFNRSRSPDPEQGRKGNDIFRVLIAKKSDEKVAAVTDPVLKHFPISAVPVREIHHRTDENHHEGDKE